MVYGTSDVPPYASDGLGRYWSRSHFRVQGIAVDIFPRYVPDGLGTQGDMSVLNYICQIWMSKTLKRPDFPLYTLVLRGIKVVFYGTVVADLLPVGRACS